MSPFAVVNKTPRSVRGLPFKRIKEKVLGKSYELSVAIVSPAESRRITKKTKRKDKVSNVLAFPLSKNSGEIILCPAAAGDYTLGYLFIHGALHLKGLKHGARMDIAEEKVLQRFNICKKSSQA